MSRLILIALVSAAAVFSTPVCYAQGGGVAMSRMEKRVHAPSAMKLRLDMRQLWEEHIVYTRNYIISGIAGLEDSQKVAERLLRNQDDIGNAVKPYYGAQAGEKLALLLRDHILIAADIVAAAKAGSGDKVTALQKTWHANADEIAGLLSGANPNWQKSALTEMLYKHLDLTTKEVVSRLNKDWAGDIDAYDQGHVHMLGFADALTDGIVKQFPKKFSK